MAYWHMSGASNTVQVIEVEAASMALITSFWCL